MEALIAATVLLLFLCWAIYFHHTVPYGAGRVKKRLDSTKGLVSRDKRTLWQI